MDRCCYKGEFRSFIVGWFGTDALRELVQHMDREEMEPMSHENTGQKLSVKRFSRNNTFNACETLELFANLLYDDLILVAANAKSLVKPHAKAHSCSNRYPRWAVWVKYMASHLIKLFN